MQIETLGNYQVHFMPLQLSGSGQWVAYLTIHRFNENAREFQCVLEKRRVPQKGDFPTASEAVEDARRTANMLIENGTV